MGKKFFSLLLSLIMVFGVFNVTAFSNIENVETIINDFTIGDNINQFKFYGNWGTSTGYPDSFYNGDEHWTRRTDDQTTMSYTIRFFGNGIKVYGNKDVAHGVANVSIDSGEVFEVDLSNSTRLSKVLLFEVLDLEEGEHTLTFVGANKRGQFSDATGMALQVDYAVILHKPYVATDILIDEHINMFELGEKQLTFSVVPSFASVSDIAYLSEDENIAKVSSSGVVTGVSQGTTAITISSAAAGISKTVKINVLKAPSAAHVIVGNSNIHYTQNLYEQVVNTINNIEKAYAWKNDKINSELVIASIQPLTNVTVTASDFISNAQTLSKDSIKVNYIKEVKGNPAYGMGVEPKPLFPDIIDTDGNTPINIAANRLQPVWIEINTPKNAKAGIYSGKIFVSAAELLEPIEINYTLEILDITMPETSEYSLSIEAWQYPDSVAAHYQVAPWSEEHINILKKQAIMAKEFASNQITVPLVDTPWISAGGIDQTYTPTSGMVKWVKAANGTLTFDFSIMDKWIELNMETGNVDKIALFGMIPWSTPYSFYDANNNKTIEHISVGSARWVEVWTAFLEAFVPHMEQKGWFNKCYMAADERSKEQMLAMINLIAKFPSLDGKILKKSFALDHFDGEYASVSAEADAVFVGYSAVANNTSAYEAFKNMREASSEKQYTTGIYTCTGMFPNSFTYSMPGESYYTMLYTGAKGANGYLRWALDAYVADPLRDTSHRLFESGDCFLIYPDEVQNKLNPTTKFSVRLRKLIEGNSDVNKLRYIAKNSEVLKEDVSKVFASVKNGYSQTGGGNASAETKALLPSDMDKIKQQIFEISKKYEAINPDNNEQMKLEVFNAKGTLGKEVVVTVKLLNNSGVSSGRFRLLYDNSKLTPISYEKFGMFDSNVFTSNIDSGASLESLEFVTFAWGNSFDVFDNGEIKIKFKISDKANVTLIPITIGYTDFSNDAYEKIDVLCVDGEVEVTDILYGDIYEDGVVNARDLTRLLQYLAHWNIELSERELQAADVCKDGEINGNDLVRLLQYLAEWDVLLG